MRHVRLSIALVLGALLGGALYADDERLALRVWTFRLPGTELGTDVADMDGDGDRDLVVAHMLDTTTNARTISVFLQGPRNARFTAKPQHRYAVPADACAFVAGDLDPAPGGEVVFLCPSRLVIVTRDGKARDLAKIAGFFDYPEDGGLPVWDLARDLDKDEIPELIVPTKTGYTVFARKKDTPLAPRSKLKVPVDQRFGPAFETKLLNRFLTSTLRLRRVVHSDLDGDGRQDLIVYREKGLARFLQRADGTFPLKPDREDRFELVSGGAKRADGKGEGEGAFANVRLNLSDVNGDGLADLLATRTLGEVGVFQTMRTQQLVFLARKDLPQTWNERKPDAVINLKGISDDPILVDWNGDGRKDLILGSYRMDMWTNVKRAIMETLTISYVIFLQRKGEAAFANEPDLSLDVEVPLESLQQRGGHRAVLFHADLDGDGVHDQVARRSDGGLQIARGRITDKTFGGKEHGFSDRPQKISLPATEPPWVIDLDGDGKDELILEPFGGDDAAARTLRVVGVAR
jgi:hypothetical protein